MRTERRDIENRADILQLLDAFYGVATNDDLIGRFFTDVMPLDLQAHLPMIADFWCSVLLDAPGYRKNVMAVHQHLHQLSPIRREHLDRWVQLFTAAVDAQFEGPRAELARQRAASVATLMHLRFHHPPIKKP